MNRFNRQLDWVTSLKGDAKIDAGSVIHWHGICTTVNLLVVLFNQVNLGESAIDTRGEREIQIKKMIVGLFYEMDGCLDFWATQLVQKGRLTKNIESKKKVFKKFLKVVGVPLLKEIRNALAFHFTDYISQPDALIATYRLQAIA